MKKLRVNLSEIADAMESSFDGEHHHYLDMETGKVILVLDEVQSAVEDEVRIDDLPDWEKDFVDETKQVLADTQGRYLEIPTLLPRDGYRQMESFAETVRDQSLKEKLAIALDGQGAFRRFKNVLEQYPPQRERWFAFKAEQMKTEVLQWLGSQTIEPLEET